MFFVIRRVLCPVFLFVLAGTTAAENPQRLDMENLRLFAEAIDLVKRSYPESIDDKKLIEGAIQGMLSGLRDSEYLDRDVLRDMSRQASFGVGLELKAEGGLTSVVSVIEDTPAQRGGVKDGDVILRVDQASVAGWPLKEVVSRLRGAEGSEVILTILRRTQVGEEILPVALKRAPIVLASVRSRWLLPHYAYVRLSQFQGNTTAHLAQHLAELYRQDSVHGLILDLRGNQGGVLQSAIGVSAIFLPPEVIVMSSDGRLEGSRKTYRTVPADYQDSYISPENLRGLPPGSKVVPMVVMVNGMSAAASEIVSGAL